MKYAIIGAGAVGGYYGSLLARYSDDVHFLLHSDFEHVAKHGLDVRSIDGDFKLPSVHVYNNPDDTPMCDIALIALKTTQNDQLPKILPRVVKEDGIIIILQNGLGIEEDVRKIMPKATIMGGLCFLCSNKTGPGQITHLDFGSVRIGQHTKDGIPAGITPALELIAKDFKKAGIKALICENLGMARWEKLVWNMAFNGLSVILDATTDRLMADPHAYNLVQNVMVEVITAAIRCGFKIEKTFADAMLETTKNMAVYNPSMRLDYQARRPLEINEIYWRPINTADSAGFNMAFSRVIAMELEFLDNRNTQISK